MLTANTQDDALGDDLAAVRPSQSDPFAASLQAQVRRHLVGAASEPFRLGRFTVLEPLGSGGMGVVFVAYDPDLDRKIALKVLRNRGERGRREVLREGRALARLKHPNVVAVFEVGTVEDGVFVAMEFVEGQNLREWLREPRTPAAILERLIEAGRGLAAAHAVDLAHHDFKPDNVVIDGAGHARVIDFGMARLVEDEVTVSRPAETAALAQTVSVHGGTPLYMAPERLAGASGDRLSDQYSFCVTCWEALFGARPEGERPEAPARRGVPGWARRVIERGLARAPGKRWPSMAALLTGLERGRARVRMRWGVVGAAAVVVLGAGAEGLRRRDEAVRVAGCAAAGDELAAVWSDEARGRLSAAFTATGVNFAASTITRVIPRIDEYVAAWAAARTDACMRVEVERVWSADTATRAASCLEDRRMVLTDLIQEFTRADATAVRKAVPAVLFLRPAAACLDEAGLERLPAPPDGSEAAVREVREALARARSLGLAGNFQAALTTATLARTRADEALGGSPLWAAARAEEGAYAEDMAAYAEAEKASTEAYFAAAKVGAWEVAAEAATRLIGIVGQHGARPAEGRVWARNAELAGVYAADWRGIAEARRLARLAIVEHMNHGLTTAKELEERALALLETAMGPDHPEVANLLNALGLVQYDLGAYPEARALFERALGSFEATLGPDHPSTANGLTNLASVALATGSFIEARGLLERALKIVEPALGADHPQAAGILGNLGVVYGSMGLHAEAQAVFERVLPIMEKKLGPEHPEVAHVLGNLAICDLKLGTYTQALARGERVLAIVTKVHGTEHPAYANALISLADAHRHMGDEAAARPLYEQGVALQEKALGPEHPLLATTLTGLGEVHVRGRRMRAALPGLTRAVEIFTANAGVQDREYDAHFLLAQALLGAGERAQALVEAGVARDGYRALGPDGAKELAEVEAWLGAQAE